MLGFRLIEDFYYEGTPVYARMRAPGGDGTIALHQAGPGVSLSSDGVRPYFEIRDLDDFCHKLQQKGFHLTQLLPRRMPWGWRHAYVKDADGHEISLYWAGENRLLPEPFHELLQVLSPENSNSSNCLATAALLPRGE